MTVKVLVSGAGGDVGQGVLKALASSSLDITCFSTCVNRHSAGLYMGAQGFLAPFSKSEEYIPFLIKLIRQLGIDVFFPTVDGEIKKIAAEKNYIEKETGAVVFVDAYEKVAVADDKLETSRYLADRSFAHPASIAASAPDTFNFIRQHGFPIVLKRRVGRGSQDVVIAKSIDEVECYIGNPDYMFQEWLDPTQGEYTSGFYIGDDGEIKGACTFRRKLKGGSTFIAERILDEVLEKPLEDIAISLGMKYLNIQSMRRDDVLVPFEFNGRLSGSTSIVSRLFNAPEMFIREKLRRETLRRVASDELFVAMRYYDEVYVSSDEVERLVSRSARV